MPPPRSPSPENSQQMMATATLAVPSLKMQKSKENPKSIKTVVWIEKEWEKSPKAWNN